MQPESESPLKPMMNNILYAGFTLLGLLGREQQFEQLLRPAQWLGLAQIPCSYFA